MSYYIFFVFHCSNISCLSLEEKIGQLFVIPVCEFGDEEHFKDVRKIIIEGKAGGILFKAGTVQGQIALIEKLQSIAPIPLLCFQDAEWGLNMRLIDAPQFPRNLTLSAIQDLSLLYQFGKEVGKQCLAVGAHINLAPVVDVNNNPLNPIIHMRSFGDDPDEVAKRGIAVMRGMQEEGIYACAKHFPGHGNTSIDSHLDLPIIKASLKELEQIELFPFSSLIKNGVKAIMTAHLCVNALAKEPVTFSKKIVTKLLQEQLRFSGLVITDALNMRALSKDYSAPEIAIKALLAGHDILLYGDHIAPKIDQILRFDVPQSFDAIKSAVKNGEIAEEIIDAHVNKIMAAKQELGLFDKKIKPKINFNLQLKKQLYEEAITLVRNEQMVPISEEKIALIHRGKTPFFDAFFSAPHFSLEDPQLIQKLRTFSKAILILESPPQFCFGPEEEKMIEELNRAAPTLAVIFGTPYSLTKLPHFPGVILAYENTADAQEAAAKVVLGHFSARGKLPVKLFYLSE